MSKTMARIDYIRGLDVSKAAHAIMGDGAASLTVSENGWTDEEGVWRVARRGKVLYTGYSDIDGFAAGRMNGEDHLVWTDGDDVYDNGVKVTSVTSLGLRDVKVRDFDGKFLIFTGVSQNANYVYDGNIVREFGPWQPQVDYKPIIPEGRTYIKRETVAAGTTITAVADNGDGTTRITTAGNHGLLTGEVTYIKGADVGWLNKTWTVTRVDATNFDITYNSDGAIAWSSGGTLYNGASGLSGVYKFYSTCVLELTAGGVTTTLESKPRGLREDGSAQDSLEAEALTITDTDYVFITVAETVDAANNYFISGSAGVDYKIGFRLYRTKESGEDFYFATERLYDDGDVNLDGAPRFYHTNFFISDFQHVPDDELGAVYSVSNTEFGSPPAFDLVANYGSRLWFNDTANPKYLWWGSLEGADYVPAENFIVFPDDITGLYEYGDGLAVFSADRIWVITMPGGLPARRRIKSPVGTTFGDAMTLTDRGLLFLREDGLWSFDGYRADKVSRVAFSSITSPTTVTSAGDTIFMSGTSEAFVVRERNGGDYWHKVRTPYITADSTSGKLYGEDGSSVYELFAGDCGDGSLETGEFIGSGERIVTEVVLDFDGDTIPVVWINGNRYSSWRPASAAAEGGESTRRLLRYFFGGYGSAVPIHNHAVKVRIDGSGDLAVYGIRPAVQ